MQHVRHKRTQLTDAHLTGFRRSEPGEHETYDALKKSEKKIHQAFTDSTGLWITSAAGYGGELIGALTSTGGLAGITEIKRSLKRISRDRTRALLVLPL